MRLDEPRWQIYFKHFDPNDQRRREALLALGNGLLSWRASAPEAAAAPAASSQVHYAGFYRAGWYDSAAREVNAEAVHMAALVNLPDPFGLSFSLDGEHWFGPAEAAQGYQQTLCMKRALLQRTLRFQLGGGDFKLRETRLLSLADPQLAVLRWDLELPSDCEQLLLRSVLDGGVKNDLIDKNRAYEGARLRDIAITADSSGRAALSAALITLGRRLAMALQTTCSAGALDWRSDEKNHRLVQQARCHLDGTRRLTIEKRVRVQVDDEIPVAADAARQQVLHQLPVSGFARLLLCHTRAWRQLWARIPLALDDATLERPLRLHVFHLMQTLSPQSLGQDLGFPPRTWQEGYFGQVFWDEIFAYPFLTTHFPELARELLHYRYLRLDDARERARRAGLRGAMFPWRSADTGWEQTPPFQCNPLSGHWMRDHTWRQRHVGSAIVHDAWQLYLATGDEDLLAGEAGELMLEVARFWASIGQWEQERFVIRGVIGPDEYHNLPPGSDEPGLDNNAYTNLMAVWALSVALQALDILPRDRARALCRRVALQSGEPAEWHRIIRNMYLPIRDDGVLAQFDGVEDLKPVPDDWKKGDRPRLDWMLEAKGDRADDYRLTKQPDVLMLLYLFPQPALRALLEGLGYEFSDQALRRTADYHLANLTHESSLSKVVCAGALACFDPSASWAFFRRSMGVDLDAPAQGGTIEGVHLGAMSGSLDVLQRHYLGIRPALDGLHVFPLPPEELDGVSLDIGYRGARFQFSLQGRELQIDAHPSNAEAMPITHAGGRQMLAPGERLVLDCLRPHQYSVRS
ncbi:MAG: glycosyl hydrolase family 65 protein [Halopseudomonas sp.]|uniref:glycosyl hydrolase family 65 protein n=1 Tax=Halopseudomonas sp. TaxID=2901191 RepID=UPI0030030532